MITLLPCYFITSHHYFSLYVLCEAFPAKGKLDEKWHGPQLHSNNGPIMRGSSKVCDDSLLYSKPIICAEFILVWVVGSWVGEVRDGTTSPNPDHISANSSWSYCTLLRSYGRQFCCVTILLCFFLCFGVKDGIMQGLLGLIHKIHRTKSDTKSRMWDWVGLGL